MQSCGVRELHLCGTAVAIQSASHPEPLLSTRTCTSVQLIVRGGAVLPLLIWPRQGSRLKVIRWTVVRRERL
jgi:hypothetical protein